MNTELFIKRPILATVISLIIVLCGLVALKQLPISQFPNISPPTISVSAAYPGANAETGAKVVAAQIENQLNGVANLMYMYTSTSATGNINITITYAVGTDLNYAINEVLNRLQAAMPLLPDVVQRIGVVARKSSPDMLLSVAFYTDPAIDLRYVSNYLKRTVQNDLLMLPTVGMVSTFGAGAYAMRVWLEPNLMQFYKLSVEDVQDAIEDQNQEYLVGRTNAVPQQDINNISINTLGQSMYETPKQFSAIIIKNDHNKIVRIKDIAKVELGSDNYNIIAATNFRDESGAFKSYPCTFMQIFLSPNANQLEAKTQIMQKLEEDSKRFPFGLHYRITLDNSRFVAASVTNVANTMKIAFLLVAVVIFIFLQNIRASLIALCTIPVAIIGTMSVLKVLGFSLNTLSLFAFILAIGIVADDAIVIVENIERLRTKHPDWSIIKTIKAAMNEVFGAIIAIMLVLSVVFLPVMALSGLSGIMYRQFAVTIAAAVVLSGLSALTLTPAISALILQKTQHKPQYLAWFDRGFNQFTNFYLRIATYLMYRKKFALAIWLIVILSMIMMFKLVPLGFIPNEDQGLIFATINLPSSSSLQETDTTVAKIMEKLTKNASIDSVTTISGLDFLDFANQKSYASSLFVVLKDWDQRTTVGSDADSIISDMNKLGSQSSGMTVRAFNQPPMRGLSTTGGVEFYLEDRINGDPRKLQSVAAELITKLKTHKEVLLAFQTLDVNVLELAILPNIDRAKFYGANLTQLYNALQSIYSNNSINYAYIMQGLVWVMLQAQYSQRSTLANLSNIFIHSSSTNKMIPINNLVQIKTGHNAQVIQRFNDYIASKITVIPMPGHAMGDVIKLIEQEINNIPKGYNYEWFGTSYQQKQSQSTSRTAFIFSLLMIYLVLAALYERWSLPLVVILGIPCALFGSGLILLLSHRTNDLYFQISLIALLGLAAKNIILLSEFALQYFKQGYSPEDSALKALESRFRPIVMTSVTFISGTIPLVFATGAGANAQKSVGLGIIGGILGSILLGTLLSPVFFALIMKKTKPRPEQ